MYTKKDYLYIKDNNVIGWVEKWGALLDRFTVNEGELVEDSNARIFKLGFTVDEVEKAIGFSGLTSREIEWRESHPKRYQMVDGEWREIKGWKETEADEAKLYALNDALAAVDKEVITAQSQTFEYDGHNYYIDKKIIVGIASALPLLPDDYIQEWKTADKLDGINNVYVVLDKKGIAGVAMACLSAFTDRWALGDSRKKALKAAYFAEVG